ncbi:MAG TPA: hypothetical protein VNT51_13560 [Miltoncostaeaceae bacterium]|nr:hypothetical protein [Miltoncostaeaceae bacterium]
MNWIWDNAVLLAFLVGLVAVLVALAVLVLRGLRLYRTVRRSAGTMSAAARALADDVQRVADAAAGVPERQAEIARTLEDVQRQAAALGVLARHTLAAQRILLGPLRYMGR